MESHKNTKAKMQSDELEYKRDTKCDANNESPDEEDPLVNTEPAADRTPSWCKKLWCNLWSPTIEANTSSLVYWQIFFILIDVASAMYSLVLDERLGVSDTWGLINDAVSVPVIVGVLVTLRYRYPPWLDRLSLVLAAMSILYFSATMADAFDLGGQDNGPRSTRIGQSVIILLNDLCLLWLWVNLWYYVPILRRAWNDTLLPPSLTRAP